ncbi:MAG TPA: radical SAM protein [Acidobacteriota bacterium]|nr:radical SAM protein [Acidobacteriota bacterium]
MAVSRIQRTTHRLRLLQSYLRRRIVCPGLPVTAIISSTSRCNLRCPMCPRAISEFGNADIEFDLFRKVIDEGSRYFEFAVLQGAGEPLLNKDIVRMVRYCKERGIRAGFSTNATLLRGDRVDELLLAGLDYIILAFDGATPEVYERYRSGAHFEETHRNIVAFLQRKRELRSPIHVTVQMVRLPDNDAQIPQFRKMWRVPGVDQVRIKEDEIGVANVCLPAAPTAKAKNPCHYLWQGPIYIEETGNVFPCCHAWTGQPLGNIREESLERIWNSERMQAMRAAHIRGDASAFPECCGCMAARPRLPLIVGSFLVDMYSVRKIIPLIERLNLLFRFALFEKRSKTN